jgi:hypothetical protein
VKQFDIDELGLIHSLLGASLDTAKGNGAPPLLISLMESAIAKLEPVIEQRCNEYNEFQSIAEQLDDLYIASKIIAKNPDAVTTEYN